MSRFKRGMIVGGLVGGFLVWLHTSKNGQATRKEIKRHTSEIFARVREQVLASGAWETLEKNKYMDHVRDMVDRYIVETGLATDMKAVLVTIVGAYWRILHGEIKRRPRKRMSL